MKACGLLLLGAFVMTGCGDSRRNDVPSTATQVGAPASQSSQRAPADATVYVKDINSGKIIYSGPVSRDQEVTVDARRNQVRIDGKPVESKSLLMAGAYGIYFDAAHR